MQVQNVQIAHIEPRFNAADRYKRSKPETKTNVHYTTTKTTKVYIHQENVLNRVAATSAAASPSILYPKKTLPTTSNV